MRKIQYLDSHAHLMGEEYQEDLQQVVQRSAAAGVDHIMIITLNKDEALRAIEFVKSNPEKYVIATGIFPEDAEHITEQNWKDFVEIAS